ncbi:hypothetical protein DFJ73DRAFT_774105 [Zopfochytrium polystomum]|nr:hypothetical protein DFJ73DRAFT_774105 [Zopfochytrium polystomum]
MLLHAATAAAAAATFLLLLSGSSPAAALSTTSTTLPAASPTPSPSACNPDLLVDDFRPRTPDLYSPGPSHGMGPDCNEPANFKGCNTTLDLIGGYYEGVEEDGTVFTLDPAGGRLVVDVGTTGTKGANSFSVAFFKDLSNYSAIAIDLVAPVGFDFNISLSPSQGADSPTRRTLASYLTPSAAPQSLLLPIADLLANTNPPAIVAGKLRFANFAPPGASLSLSKITLKGACGQTASLTTSAPGVSTQTLPLTVSKTTTSGAWSAKEAAGVLQGGGEGWVAAATDFVELTGSLIFMKDIGDWSQ